MALETDPAGSYKPFPAFSDWTPAFDPGTVAPFADRLSALRSQVTQEQIEAAVHVATRYAAVDTGAIEGLYTTNRGFTKTIATQTAAWEVALRQRGDEVARSIEDALRGYEMVLDAVTGSVPLSESWVRQLHHVLCNSQETYDVWTSGGWQKQPLPKGEYKRFPNNPTSVDTGRVHQYSPVSDTPAEMNRLLGELSTKGFLDAHPVVQAAYAHYAFVCIHPFADGNGRVARALGSLFLYREPGVPLVVFADQKDVYLDALEAADGGDFGLLTSFVRDRVVETIGLVETSLDVPSAREAEASLDRLRKDLSGRAGLSHAEFDALVKTTAVMALRALTDELAALDLPGVQISNSPGSPRNVPDGYRAPGGQASVVHLRASAPTSSVVSIQLSAWAAKPAADVPDLCIRATNARDFGVLVPEVHPAATEAFRLRMDAWAIGVARRAAHELQEVVHAQLVKLGYVDEETYE